MCEARSNRRAPSSSQIVQHLSWPAAAAPCSSPTKSMSDGSDESASAGTPMGFKSGKLSNESGRTTRVHQFRQRKAISSLLLSSPLILASDQHLQSAIFGDPDRRRSLIKVDHHQLWQPLRCRSATELKSDGGKIMGSEAIEISRIMLVYCVLLKVGFVQKDVDLPAEASKAAIGQ
ncbi:hypothetical protein ACLOJK_018489 [Asimina triloba]